MWGRLEFAGFILPADSLGGVLSKGCITRIVAAKSAAKTMNVQTDA